MAQSDYLHELGLKRILSAVRSAQPAPPVPPPEGMDLGIVLPGYCSQRELATALTEGRFVAILPGARGWWDVLRSVAIATPRTEPSDIVAALPADDQGDRHATVARALFANGAWVISDWPKCFPREQRRVA